MGVDVGVPGIMDSLKTILVYGPILGLLAVGFLVSLRSGVVSLSTPQGFRLLLSNLSLVLLRLIGFLAGLFAVQQMIGYPIRLGW
jgi:hypothetical protein